MKRISAVIGASAIAASALISAVPAAHAGTINNGNLQWFTGGSGGGYYARMSVSTTVKFSGNGETAYQEAGDSRGGAYYSGPYGDSAVTANRLRSTWTITLDSEASDKCSIGFPSGFSCEVRNGRAVATRTSGFGASKPTSDSLPSKSYSVLGDGSWKFVQYDSEWEVRYAPHGTVIQKTVGDSNKHTR